MYYAILDEMMDSSIDGQGFFESEASQMAHFIFIAIQRGLTENQLKVNSIFNEQFPFHLPVIIFV